LKVLVTGGGGFLGSAIVRGLVERGHTVSTLQRGQYAWHGELGVEAHAGDIAEPADVRRAVDGCQAVIHTAAKAGVWGSAGEYERTNVRGTEIVVDEAQRAGVERFVFTSSPSVVFTGEDEEGIDESVPYPQSYPAEYPRTKALSEQCVLAANSDSFRTVALRPRLIWGPGDHHLVPRIVERAQAGQLRLIGDGSNRVDSTYLGNAADAHFLALDRLQPESPVAGRAYFITNGEPLPMAELINKILAATGCKPVRKTLSPRLAHVAGAILEGVYGVLWPSAEPPLTRFVARQLCTAHWFDISAARRDLGYEPRVSIDEGMRRLAEDWQSHGE